MTTTDKTKSLPMEDRRADAVEVAGLRRVDTGDIFDIGERVSFVVGKGEACDWVIDDECVSRIHSEFERQGDVLLIRDRSTNGTYINGRQVGEAEVMDRDFVRFGRVDAVAFTAESRGALSAAERLRGAAPALLAAKAELEAATRAGRSVLLCGQPGTGKALLAQWAHERFAGPRLPFVIADYSKPAQVSVMSAPGAFDALVDRARGGTLMIKRAGNIPRVRHTAVINALRTACAPHAGPLRTSLALTTVREEPTGELLTQYERMGAVVLHVPPLRERAGDVESLVDWFITEWCGHGREVSLSPATRAAVAKADWPGNVAELQRAVQIAAALTQLGSMRKAAEAVGIPRTTLRNWLVQLGLPTKPPW